MKMTAAKGMPAATLNCVAAMRPWLGESTAILSPSFISPIATPATGAVIGTPASISARIEPQTVAIEDEPLDS